MNWDHLLQEIGNGLGTGGYIALLSIGYALIFGTTREFHFAHGSVFMVAAWVLFVATARWGWPFVPALVASALAAMALGVVIERGFYAPIRDRSTRHVGVVLTGLGLFYLIENIVVILEGSQIRYPENPIPGSAELGGVFVSWVQVAGIVGAIAVLAGLIVFLRRSRLGRSIRAVGSNPALAYTIGVDAEHTRMWAFAIGSGITALAAAAFALDVGFAPPMGLQAMLLATVAVIVGGIGSLAGAAIAGFVLGLAQHAGYLGIGSEWQNPIAFGVLMLVILVRPRGLAQRT
jgi:branched-subunit amino acid ABC-type transport system permease component